MYGTSGLTQNAMQVQRVLALQRLRQQQQQQQQLMLQQQYSTIAQPLQMPSSAVVTSLPPMISSPPLAMADLKPSVLLVFQRLLRDYSDQYRLANEEKEKSKAQSIVKTFYDTIASECAPTEELVKELPPRNRLEDLIRSSLDFGLTRASTEKKTVQNLYGKQKPSSQASHDSVEGTATNDSPITTLQDIAGGRTGIPAGVTISLSAKRAYRQAVEEANKKNLDQQQAILRLNQQQEYLRQLNNCLASQNRIPANDLLDRQETLCLQHRCMEHYEQKRQCMQVIAVLEQWQSEARNILNRQSLDPVTRSKIANGLLERQYVIDSQSVHLDALIEQEKKLSARTNPTLNQLSAKKETNASDSTTMAAKEDKSSSKGDAMGKPSAKASSRLKRRRKKSKVKAIHDNDPLKSVREEQTNMRKGSNGENIHTMGQKTTNLPDSRPSADDKCSVQDTLPVPLSPLSSSLPSLVQKVTKRSHRTKLTSVARRNLKNLATHNRPRDIINDKCDVDAILHDKGSSQKMDRKSRRQRTIQKPEPPKDTSLCRKRKRIMALPVSKSSKSRIEEDTELAGTKAEKKPSTLKKTKQKKKKKKKSTPFLNRIEGVVRPDTPTSSALVDVGNNGDNNPLPMMMKISHTATLEKTTRKTSTDRKRRKKKRKKQLKRKKAEENPQPLELVPEEKPPEKQQTGISAPASGDGPQVSRSDGPIPEYLPPSVQKALKHLAPHNIPGNTTVGDNAFIIDTALYDSSSRVQTRKRRRDNR